MNNQPASGTTIHVSSLDFDEDAIKLEVRHYSNLEHRDSYYAITQEFYGHATTYFLSEEQYRVWRDQHINLRIEDVA